MSEAALPDVLRLRAWIEERLALTIDDTKLPALSDLLRVRAAERSSAPADYLDALERQPAFARQERGKLAERLTVGETSFFRHREQWRVFTEVAVPARLRETNRIVRVLCAGCATGEEPYTMAMLLADHDESVRARIEIRAVDVNPAAIERAAAGVYSAWSLRETPDAMRARWFRARGRDFEIDDAIKRAVRLDERNLAEDDPSVFAPEAYDIVFCRNVLMYQSPAGQRATVARLARSMSRGGYLFLGHAETLRGVSQDFALRQSRDAFYWIRRPANASAIAHDDPNGIALERAADAAWFAEIERSSARVRELTDARPDAHPERALHAPPETSAEPPIEDALGAASADDDATFVSTDLLAGGDATRWLSLRIENEEYAIAVDEMAGLVRAPAIMAVPSDAPALRGVATVRGDIVPVWDLAALIGRAPSREPSRWLVMCHRAEPVGLVGCDVTGTFDVARGEVGEGIVSGEPCITRAVRVPGHEEPRRVIDVLALMRAIEDQTAASGTKMESRDVDVR